MRKHTKSKSKVEKIIVNMILIILIGISIYSGGKVILWIRNDKETKKIEEELLTKVVVPEEPNKANAQEVAQEESRTKIDFTKLEEINTDIFAWIKIEGTNINYPILQGKTDEYYLERNIYKKYNGNGSIFVDSSTQRDFSDDNTVIYGHNIKNGRMFADLNKIYKGELGKEIEVEIINKETQNSYKVFSACKMILDRATIKKNFKEEEKEKYIKKFVEKSAQPFEADIDTSKGILTLVTCDSTGKQRIVVHAIKN